MEQLLEFIIIAVAGSVLAGVWDLKTTEVPDEIPALMISAGIFLWYVRAASFGELHNLALSLTVGTLLLAFGLLLYKYGQWGGADAWILAAIGYLIPAYNNRIFIVDYLFNFLLVSVIYMIIYAIILGFLNQKLFSYFSKEVRARWKVAAGVPLLFAVFSSFLIAATNAAVAAQVLISLGLIIILVFFWIYAKVIEKYAFRKKIPAGKLKPGDVLESMVWRGITQDEIDGIKKRKKFVVVKEGVRFVPAFPITLVITLLYGNLFFSLL